MYEFEEQPRQLGAPAAPNPMLAALAQATPGPETLSALALYRPAELHEFDRVTLLDAWERQRGWFDAHAQRAIVGVGGPTPERGNDDWAREEIAAALRLSINTADQRLDTARELVHRLPNTLAGLERGEFGYWHAKALATATRDLSLSVALEVEARVLPHAAEDTLARFRRRIAKAVLDVDPDAAEQAHDKALAERKVEIYGQPNAMSTLAATLRADHAEWIFQTITAHATKTGPDDDRGIDARRADAFYQLFCTGAGTGLTTAPAASDGQTPAPAPTPVPQVQLGVTIDTATLLGLAEHPGELGRYGPIPAKLARELASSAFWRRFVTDPMTGELLDRGAKTYEPSQRLKDYLAAKHQTCIFPGCGQPARRCDTDHRVPFDDGGQTTRANCAPLCRRHHRLKHNSNWKLERLPDGSHLWTSPHGHTYKTKPPDLRPDG